MKKIVFRKLAPDCIKFFLLTSFTMSTIIWVLQAVNFLDFIVEDGHGFLVYFNYTVLSFPKILSRTYPFAIFLSITYILLKYENNNEVIIFWNCFDFLSCFCKLRPLAGTPFYMRAHCMNCYSLQRSPHQSFCMLSTI